MAFTLQQAIQLNILKNADVIAGGSGLRNHIGSVFILDYEYREYEAPSAAISHHRNGLALLGMKLYGEQFTRIVKRLILGEACALIAKGYTVKEIPNEAIAIADASNFPVFTLSQAGERFENIIVELNGRINDYESLEKFESKISSLVKDSLPRSVVHTLGTELAVGVRRPYYTVYCYPRSEQNDVAYREALRLLNARSSDDISVKPFRGGILFLVSYYAGKYKDIMTPIRTLLHNNGIAANDYFIGIGRVQEYFEDMDYAIRESICAAICTKHNKCGVARFNTICFNRFLLPIRDDHWVVSFCKDILSVIMGYDAKYGTELYKTMCSYVDNDGDIAKTAEELHVHKNTVRYRVQKTKELLHLEEGQHFYAQLCVAICWSHIHELSL